jgi:hypothetical protein
MKLVICLPTSNSHYLESNISHIAICDTGSSVTNHYPISLTDIKNVDLPKIEGTCVVLNKRLFDRFYDADSYDLETFYWLRYNKPLDSFVDFSIFNTFKKFYSHIDDFYRYIPFMRVKEFCETLIKKFLVFDFTISKADKFYSNVVYKCVTYIESNGLKVDLDLFNTVFNKSYSESLVKSFYSLHNITGRPSNTFDNVNFSALNKTDDSRRCFISRFDGGYLLEFDFDAYHIRLISHLMGYELPKEGSVHNYLGRYYFNKDSLTEQEYIKSKSITFKYLYSDDVQAMDIPFFAKASEYKEKIWKEYSELGYLVSPLSGRVLSKENLGEMKKSKLFNYFIQMIETEFSMLFIYKVYNILKDRRSKIIMYTYDSILIDFNVNDKKEVISEIKDKIIKSKVKIGKNYKDMETYSF